MWWRNLTLIWSMVVFGLWHKATILFLIWGCYHGALLVAHRLVQTERSFHWQPPKIWTPLSWFATATLISLGWIPFRTNSLAQARQMLAAIASPESYGSHFLSSSLSVLIGVLAGGYSVVMLVSDALDRVSTESSRQSSAMVSWMARARWY